MVAAKSAGSFLGGILNNPGAVILGGLAIGLLFFSKDIRQAFGSLGENFGKIELPDITLPAINFPEFPKIEFPDFTNIFQGFQDQLSSIAGQTVPSGTDGTTVTIPSDTIINADGTVSSSTPPLLTLDAASKEEALRQLEINRLRSILEQELAEIPSTEDISGSEFTSAINDAEFRARQEEEQEILRTIGTESEVFVPTVNEFDIGGGPSFIGGTTTFGDNLIDSLSEVLSIFPQLTASQARDVLEENPDLSASQFRLINPDVINISNAEIENQVFLNSSGDFTGLTPEQIAKLLTGGNISNF